MQPRRFWAIALFVLLNAALLAWGGTYWLRGRINEWQRIQSTRRLQENLFALKEQRLSDLDENKASLAQARLATEADGLVVLPYSLLAEALDFLRSTGSASGLKEISFYTGEIVRLDGISEEEESVMAFNGTIICEGFFDNIIVFLQTIVQNEWYCRFNRFAIESENGIFSGARIASRITLDFAFYIREE